MMPRLQTLEEAWPLIRDILFVAVGLVLLINEAFHAARPGPMGVYLVVMGLPLPIRSDERRRRRREEDR
jgi:hypothetical protein